MGLMLVLFGNLRALRLPGAMIFTKQALNKGLAQVPRTDVWRSCYAPSRNRDHDAFLQRGARPYGNRRLGRLLTGSAAGLTMTDSYS